MTKHSCTNAITGALFYPHREARVVIKKRKSICMQPLYREEEGFALDTLICVGKALDRINRRKTDAPNPKQIPSSKNLTESAAGRSAQSRTHPLGNTCSADAPLYDGCGKEMLKIGPLDAIFHMCIVLHCCRHNKAPKVRVRSKVSF